MRDAVIYTRISSDPEGRSLGVQRQEEDCRRLAERLELRVVDVHIDNDISASTKSKKPRPAYDAMLEQVLAGQIQVILAYSNSRLTRRPMEWDRLINLYESHGLEIHTVVSGKDDLSTADGRMVARIKASVDAAEAERVSERVTRAAQQRAELGHWHSGHRPYGWDDDLKSLHPEEHAVIVEMTHRILAGESLRGLVRDLNERGIKSRTGKDWSTIAVRKMLLAPRMIGWRSSRDKQGRDQPVKRGYWEPQLDEQTWHQIVALLTDEDRMTRGVGNTRVNLLTGLVRCGECESPMTIRYGTKTRYSCPGCHLSRTQRVVDDYVNEYMRVRLATVTPVPVEPLDAVQVQAVEALRVKIAATLQGFTHNDSMTVEQLRTTMRDLNARLTAAEAKLLPPRRRTLLADSPDWDALTMDRKRAIIAELVEIRLHRVVKGRNTFDPETIELTPL